MKDEIRITRYSNGVSVEGEEETEAAVFVTDTTDSIIDFLYYILYMLGLGLEGRYEKERIRIIKEAGDKYQVKENEKWVEETIYRVEEK